jgi:NAD(P)-dependent dehydrogenase (short-subunit alcohol dehydrogenase family)
MENKNVVALVTGSSTGIGYETSLALARNGFYTYATMRDITKGDAINKIADRENLPLEILPLDVDNEDSVRETIRRITDKMEKIDILVNNAGYGLFGALENMSMEEIKRQFETNFFGAVRTIKAVLPTMRKQRSGIIINVTSIAGVVGIPGECIYSSSKFALEGLTESISYELQPYGIKVILIEPGVINTNFVPNIKYPDNVNEMSKGTVVKKEDWPESGISRTNSNNIVKSGNNNISSSHYSETIEAFLSHYYTSMKNAPPPTLVSDVVIEAIRTASSRPSQYLFRYTVGEDSESLATAKRNMSDLQLHDYVSTRLLR